jgi:hypothetical protein
LAVLSARNDASGKLFDRYTLAHAFVAQVPIGLVVVESVDPDQINDGFYDYPSSAKPPAGS